MIDPTANSLEHLVTNEELELAGDAGDRFIAVADQLFYDKDFQLWKIGGDSQRLRLSLGVDYRFIFKVPVFRSQDTVHAVYAAIEFYSAASGDRYVTSYRALGTPVGVVKEEVIRVHQANTEISGVNFYGLLTPNGNLPDGLRLRTGGFSLTPVLISYTSSIGAAENAAQELNFTGEEIALGGELTIPDATASKKGAIKLAGDLEGTADDPRVKGLAEKISVQQATDMFLTSEDADAAYATRAQGVKADEALPTSEADSRIRQVGDARYVRTVNSLLPDENGNVVISGGGGGGGGGGGSGGIDGGIF